jgi:hypothetical protein
MQRYSIPLGNRSVVSRIFEKQMFFVAIWPDLFEQCAVLFFLKFRVWFDKFSRYKITSKMRVNKIPVPPFPISIAWTDLKIRTIA